MSTVTLPTESHNDEISSSPANDENQNQRLSESMDKLKSLHEILRNNLKEAHSRKQPHYARVTSRKRSYGDSSFADSNIIQYLHSISRKRKSVSSADNVGFDLSDRSSSRADDKTYCPYDKSGILNIISTYQSSLNWNINSYVVSHEKNTSLSQFNPVKCSLNGWICLKRNRLCCVTCNSTFHVKFPDIEDDPEDELLELLAQEYLGKLHSQHLKNCPWLLRPAQPSVYEISAVNQTFELKQFQIRLDGILKATEMPDFNLPVDFENIAKSWFSKTKPVEQCSLHKLLKAFKIALLGWLEALIGTLQILRCNCCNMEVLLDQNELDLIEDHAFWCCFVEKNTSGHYGFQSLLKMIKLDCFEKKTFLKDYHR